ncbi:MAG: hypothetical protein ABSG03_15420 [Bryobacteraceae bacterium]|jgi:hypothetical protein
MSWESEGIALLTASLVRPFGLAATAWLMLRALRVRHPASQHAVWTAVLIIDHIEKPSENSLADASRAKGSASGIT